MVIKTKYSVGDTVFKMTSGTVTEHIVGVVVVTVGSKEDIRYRVSQSSYDEPESKFYTSAEECMVDWVKAQGFEIGVTVRKKSIS